jgi:hypothetical protein
MVVKVKYSLIDNPNDFENVDKYQFVHFSREAYNELPELDKLNIKDSLSDRIYEEENYVVFAFSKRNLFKFIDFMTRDNFWS